MEFTQTAFVKPYTQYKIQNTIQNYKRKEKKKAKK